VAVRDGASHAAAEGPEEFAVLRRRRVVRLGAEQHEAAIQQDRDGAGVLLPGPPPLVFHVVVAADQVAVVNPPVDAVTADFVVGLAQEREVAGVGETDVPGGVGEGAALLDGALGLGAESDGRVVVVGDQRVDPGVLAGGPVFVDARHEFAVVFVRVHRQADGPLLEVAAAHDGFSLLLGPAQGRHQDRHQQRDDRDDDQKLNQCECPVFSHDDAPTHFVTGLNIRPLL